MQYYMMIALEIYETGENGMVFSRRMIIVIITCSRLVLHPLSVAKASRIPYPVCCVSFAMNACDGAYTRAYTTALNNAMRAKIQYYILTWLRHLIRRRIIVRFAIHRGQTPRYHALTAPKGSHDRAHACTYCSCTRACGAGMYRTLFRRFAMTSGLARV